MNIELYDMLVFEDETGSIYQDCVCGIDNKNEYCGKSIYTNVLRLILNKDENAVEKIVERVAGLDVRTFRLKEIWHRTDEDTYKKVWSINRDGLISIRDYENDIFLDGYKEGLNPLENYCENIANAISEKAIKLLKESLE